MHNPLWLSHKNMFLNEMTHLEQVFMGALYMLHLTWVSWTLDFSDFVLNLRILAALSYVC